MQLGVNADEREKPLILPRLLHKVARPTLDGLDGQIDVAPRGHHDHRDARVDLLDAGEQIEAFLAGGCVAGVVEVDQQDVVVALAHGFKQEPGRADAGHVDACGASSSSTASRMWG